MCISHDTTDDHSCQTGTDEVDKKVLNDVGSTGKKRPWREKKLANEHLAEAYLSVNLKKSMRLRECANMLVFNVDSDGAMKLKTMNSCRVRLCPICGWRRQLKVFYHTMAILDAMEKDKHNYAYIFLTLTVKNCDRENLISELDRLMGSWQRFIQRKAIKNIVKGWYRGLEITHNINPLSDFFDTYHPHFHCLLAVDKYYFKSHNYLSKASWAKLWKQSLRINYEPIVDVRKIEGNTAKAVAEAAKYTVKDSDYIIPDDWDLTVSAVKTLDEALDGRRLVAYGGTMKEWHKKLNLDDEVDGDLVHTGEEDELSSIDKQFVFWWNTGFRQYILNE